MDTRLFSITAVAAAALLLPLAGHAQTFTDNAANPAYANGYSTGSGLGTPGFSAFNVTTTGASAGTFVYTAGNSEGGNGTPAPSSIDSSNVSFGMYANSGPSASTTVSRTFAAPGQASGLNVAGDMFSLDFVTGYNDGLTAAGAAGGGTTGVALTSGAGTVGSFLYQSNNQYFFNGVLIPGQQYTTGALHLVYNLTSATTYSFQATGAFSFTGAGTLTSPITGFQVQQVNSGGGDGAHDAFFNNLSLTASSPAAVPEASSSISLGLMLALGGLAVVARKRSVQS